MELLLSLYICVLKSSKAEPFSFPKKLLTGRAAGALQGPKLFLGPALGSSLYRTGQFGSRPTSRAEARLEDGCCLGMRSVVDKAVVEHGYPWIQIHQ